MAEISILMVFVNYFTSYPEFRSKYFRKPSVAFLGVKIPDTFLIQLEPSGDDSKTDKLAKELKGTDRLRDLYT